MSMQELAVPLPSQVIRHLPESRNKIQMIRDEIRNLIIDDDQFASEVFRYAFNPGKAGNRQMDQAVVAERLFNHVDADGGRTMLASYEMTHKELWHHFAVVMTKLGYVSQNGYFLRHAIADESNGDDQAA